MQRFQKIVNLNRLLVVDAALDHEAQFVARDPERKAEFLQTAQQYEEQGLSELAAELRRDAENLSRGRPLNLVLPTIEHLADETGSRPLARIETNGPTALSRPQSTPPRLIKKS